MYTIHVQKTIIGMFFYIHKFCRDDIAILNGLFCFSKNKTDILQLN
jgi:hypothetical protein